MLRYIIVTQDDPFYLPEFFREFQELIKNDKEFENLGLVIQKPLGKKSIKSLIAQMYGLYGPIGFFRKGTEFVFKKAFNMLALKAFRGKFPGLFSVRHFAMKNNWKIIEQSNVNSPEFVQWVKDQKLDLLVSVGGSQKFKTPVLNAPRYGCINIHNSKLPKLRGMLPTFWALLDYDQDPTSASTVFKMNEELDAGDIILQEEFRLDPEEALENLILRTKREGAHLVYRAMRLYLDGEPALRPNPASQATYRSFPTPEDIKLFRKKGYKIL